jgi:hypothetical protein
VEVSVDNARRESVTLREIREVREEEIGKMVGAWKRSGFL